MFVLSSATLLGFTYSSQGHNETSQNNVAISDGKNNYATVEEYQAATKQDKKSSNGNSITTEEHTGDHTDWLDLEEAGTTLSTGNYVLNKDFTSSSRINIASGASVTICLNGNTLDVNDEYGISFYNGSTAPKNTFILHDCSEEQSGTINVITDVNTIPAVLNVRNSASILITGGTLNLNAYCSKAVGVFFGSARALEFDMTMTGGTIQVHNTNLASIGIYSNDVYSGTILDITMTGGSILASSSSTSNSSIQKSYGMWLEGQTNADLNVTIDGGVISATNEISSYMYGLYIDWLSSDVNVTINGGYHEYEMLYLYTYASDDPLVVKAGYFNDLAYEAMKTYIPETSTTRTFSSQEEGESIDPDYDYNYRNAVYVIGDGIKIDVDIESLVFCYGTDIKQYLIFDDDSLVYLYSYVTEDLDVVDGLPTVIGDYKLIVDHVAVSVDNRIPKEINEAVPVEFNITIQDHILSDEYSYDGNYHWKECTYTYCDRVYENNENEHIKHDKGGTVTAEPTETEAGTILIYCNTCEWSEPIDFTLDDSNYTASTTTSSTCTEGGTVDYYYVHGEDTVWLYQETIPALGHNYEGDYYYESEEGHYQYCSRCEEPSSLSDHSYPDTWTTSTTQEGIEERQCTLCTYTETRNAEVNPTISGDPEEPTTPADPTDTGNPSNDPTDTDQGGEAPVTTAIDATTTTTYILHGVYIGVAVICLIAGYIAKINANKDSEISETKDK